MADEERVEQLYRTYGPAIYARCLRLLGDDAAAQDAVQETFIRVYRHLDRAPDGPTAKLWIYRIATNFCLDLLRGRTRGQLTENPFEAAETRSTEEALADRQLATHLAARAPARVQAAAWLHYVDGLELPEVARVLGVTRRTVDNRLAAFIRGARKLMTREPA